MPVIMAIIPGIFFFSQRSNQIPIPNNVKERIALQPRIIMIPRQNPQRLFNLAAKIVQKIAGTAITSG